MSYNSIEQMTGDIERLTGYEGQPSTGGLIEEIQKLDAAINDVSETASGWFDTETHDGVDAFIGCLAEAHQNCNDLIRAYTITMGNAATSIAVLSQ